MSICISKLLALAQTKNPKLQQWLWFVGLWLGGLITVVTLTIPIKLLIKFCQ